MVDSINLPKWTSAFSRLTFPYSPPTLASSGPSTATSQVSGEKFSPTPVSMPYAWMQRAWQRNPAT